MKPLLLLAKPLAAFLAIAGVIFNTVITNKTEVSATLPTAKPMGPCPLPPEAEYTGTLP